MLASPAGCMNWETCTYSWETLWISNFLSLPKQQR